MTTLTLRYIKGAFVVTAPEVAIAKRVIRGSTFALGIRGGRWC
jgi:hypothetical protein